MNGRCYCYGLDRNAFGKNAVKIKLNTSNFISKKNTKIFLHVNYLNLSQSLIDEEENARVEMRNIFTSCSK